MDDFMFFWDELTKNKLFKSVLVVLFSMILYLIAHKIVRGGEKKIKGRNLGRSRTYLRLSMSLIRYVFILFTVLFLFEINGVNVTSILAGLGLAGVIIGLAVQDALKDIIRGFSIISDHYFSVGDTIKYNNDQEGTVVSIGLRSTKLKSITNGCMVTVANRLIEQAEQCSNSTAITIPLPYELKLAQAEKIIAEIVQEIDLDANVSDVNYLGVTEFAESSINYLVSMKCRAENRRKVRRNALRATLFVLEHHHVSIPYPSRAVYLASETPKHEK